MTTNLFVAFSDGRFFGVYPGDPLTFGSLLPGLYYLSPSARVRVGVVGLQYGRRPKGRVSVIIFEPITEPPNHFSNGGTETMGAFLADPQQELLKSIANYILARAFGKESETLPIRTVPPIEHSRKHLAVMTELKFRAELKELGLGSGEISYLWDLLVNGILAERDRDSATIAGKRNSSFTAFSARPKIKELLAPGDKLALWSGGIVISQYARRLGYCCLETTRLGEMFDRVKLYRNEQALWQLWDHLATAFVTQAQRGGEIHIFVRNFDRKSTLLTVEYPRLLEMGRTEGANFRIKWHVIVGDGDQPDQLRALTEDGTPALETPGTQYWFDDPHRAELMLRSFLVGDGKHLGNAQRIMHTNRYSVSK